MCPLLFDRPRRGLDIRPRMAHEGRQSAWKPVRQGACIHEVPLRRALGRHTATAGSGRRPSAPPNLAAKPSHRLADRREPTAPSRFFRRAPARPKAPWARRTDARAGSTSSPPSHCLPRSSARSARCRPGRPRGRPGPRDRSAGRSSRRRLPRGLRLPAVLARRRGYRAAPRLLDALHDRVLRGPDQAERGAGQRRARLRAYVSPAATDVTNAAHAGGSASCRPSSSSTAARSRRSARS